MQEKTALGRTFFHRTNKLAVRMGINVQDLPEIIGISRRTLFECRSADSAVTDKTWVKLEAAEGVDGDGVQPSAQDARAVSNAESEAKVKEDEVVYGGKVVGTPTLLEVLMRIAEALEAIAKKMKDSN